MVLVSRGCEAVGLRGQCEAGATLHGTHVCSQTVAPSLFTGSVPCILVSIVILGVCNEAASTESVRVQSKSILGQAYTPTR